MSDSPAVGAVTWRDLTVPNAEQVKDFYCQVVGWNADDHPMGDYCDYNIKSPESGEVVAGICHAQGSNAKLPPVWLVYITVADVDNSAEKCRALGGEILDGPRDMGGGRICVIKDPAGAVAALFQS